MKTGKRKQYIAALRLHTLPLSLCGIIFAGFAGIAAVSNSMTNNSIIIITLTVLTTIFLQLLSNIANDLGDMQKGADTAERLGPQRGLQTGELSKKNYYIMLTLFILGAIISGCFLVYFALDSFFTRDGIIMLSLGGLAVIAAITYTMGRKAYGYYALGDLFVYLFFGLLSTMGTYFLLTQQINTTLLLPASSIGFLATGVLNLNNMRDIENDKLHNKNTLASLLGLNKAKIYHSFLIIAAFLLMAIYLSDPLLLTIPFITNHLIKVHKSPSNQLNPQLKHLSLISLLFSIIAGLTVVL